MRATAARVDQARRATPATMLARKDNPCDEPPLSSAPSPSSLGRDALRTGRHPRARTRQVFAHLDRPRRSRSSNAWPTARSTKMEDVPIGVTKPQRATLEGTADALRVEAAPARLQQGLHGKLQGGDRRLQARSHARPPHGPADRRAQHRRQDRRRGVTGSRTPRAGASRSRRRAPSRSGACSSRA